MKDLYKNLIIAALLLALFGSIWYLAGLRSELKLRQNVYENLSDGHETLYERYTRLDSLIRINGSIDSLVLLSKYLSASEIIRSFVAGYPEEKAYLDHKLDFLENILKRNTDFQTSMEDIDAVRQSQEQKIMQLHNNIKELEQGNSKLNEILADCREALTALESKMQTGSDSSDISSSKDNFRIVTIVNSKGNEIYYLGDTSEGKANGLGAGLWKKGGHYNGMWKENLRDGKGTYFWADGEHYEGEFRSDKRDGKGKYTWKNGIFYIGEWKEDKRHGTGVLYEKNGAVRLKGVWENDQFLKNIK
jgi:hypothetical protein